MIKSYLRIALRLLAKNRIYSFINIAGLAIGMATALLIGLWITDELTFDHYHTNHSRIAHVMLKQAADKPFLGGHATKEHPEVGIGLSLAPVSGRPLAEGYEDIFQKTAFYTWPDNHLLAGGDKSLERKGLWVQAAFPEILTFQMLAGTTASLNDPQTILLGASTADALFGKQDPIGQIVRLDNDQSFRVGGVYADLPLNTSFHDIQLLLSWNNKKMAWARTSTDWSNHGPRMIALLANQTSFDQATERIKSIPTSHFTDHIEELLAYPFDRFYLQGEFDHESGAANGGKIRFVWLFGTIGAFVLLLACINFMNLSTARSQKRAREVGIRKTIGSLRSQLIAQFLGESTLTALFAFLIAIIIAAIALPAFNSLAAKAIQFPWANSSFWVSALAFTLITGLLAGSYPALYLSSFSPVRGFTGTTGLARKILVVTQFSVSLSLIIGTIVVFRQIQFAKDRPLGYDRANLLTVYENTDTLHNQYSALRNELIRSGLVTSVAESSQATTQFDNNNSLAWSGMSEEKKNIFYRNITVDPDFGKTVGWQVIKGRDFSRDFPTDSDAMILNESGANWTGFKDPIGKTVIFWDKPYHIIGVIRDMLTNSPYSKVEAALFIQRGWQSVITLRLNPNAPLHKTIAGLEPIFKKYNPVSPFLYHFNDDEFAAKFAQEDRIGDISIVFSSLAILISCLGLFGLAAFVAEQRTKEIGVRKVLGANILSLWSLLSKDFVALVVLSMAISMPLMGLAMQKWLQNYEIHTSLSWWIFAAAGAGTLLITLLTVSYQSIKAARMNPTKSLRSE
jgi:ABC-type antimicrobial peptide transport system permease subunit